MEMRHHYVEPSRRGTDVSEPAFQGHQDVRDGSGVGSPSIAEPDGVPALLRRLQEKDGQIRRLSRELNLAERHERDRIARVLHDEFQQLLFALKMRIDAVLGGSSMEVHGGTIRELVEQVSALTRTLIVNLAPPIYESEDFSAALEWLAQYVGDRYEVQVEVRYDQQFPIPDEERRIVLLEAVRELLFNVVKHGGVNEAAVSVQREGDGVSVVVSDEGNGFDVEAVGLEHGATGFGLPQLRRRLHLVGGRMHIESAPGEGTRVSMTVPMGDPPAQD